MEDSSSSGSARRIKVKYRTVEGKRTNPKLGKLLSTWTTALANYSCQYNFQSIAISLLIMSTSECTTDAEHCRSGEQDAWVHGTANAVIFIGAVCGQLCMGILGDYITRNSALSVTLFIAAVASLLSAVAPNGSPNMVYGIIIVFRFIIGIGLGGIYPLSATKASEDSASNTKKTNSSGSAFAFFWQIPGLLSPWLLALVFTYTSLSTSYRWRLILGLGAVPSCLAICCLLGESYLLQESLIKRKSAEQTTDHTAAPSTGIVMQKLRDPVVLQKLLACGGTWFLYDVIFYGLSLLGGHVISAISNGDDDVSSDASIRNLCSKQTIATALGIMPMAWSLYLLPRLSLKYLQLWGFIVQAFFLSFFLLFFSYLSEHSTNGLFALYCLALTSLQLGAPVTTYALPAAVFEKDIRCTFNGIAAAMGKLGAIVGAYTFYYIAKASIHAVLAVCVIVCLIGAYVTKYMIHDSYLMNDDSATHMVSIPRDSIELDDADSEIDEVIMFSPLPQHSVHSAHAADEIL